MIIRDMTISDYEEVLELMKEVHTIHVKNRPDIYNEVDELCSRQQFNEDVKNENVISILVEEGSKIVGICFVSFREKTCMVKKRTAYMDDLCVDKTYRKRGIGTMLFQYALEKAKTLGAERLDLMVWGFNETAFNFYERMNMNVQRFILEKTI